MKKLLLIAALAASSVAASAATFGEYFKLTFEDQTIENGQTVTVKTYEDAYADLGVPGYSQYNAVGTVYAHNVYDELMDIWVNMSCVDNKTDKFQLCYGLETGGGNCFGSDKLPFETSVESETYMKLDIDELDIKDLSSPTTFKLDFYVKEGGEKIEGTDATIYVTFTHETDITAAVEGISVENGVSEYYTLQGVKVANPEKGNIYIVRNGSTVSKKLF